MGNVDVMLPVYMIFDNDMAFIALIPKGIPLTGRVGYTGITFQRSSLLHIVGIINSSCIIWQKGSSRKLSVINKTTYVDCPQAAPHVADPHYIVIWLVKLL